jgi:DNA-binding response OmpR family regulator
MKKALFLGSQAKLKPLEGVLADQSFEVQRPAKNKFAEILKLGAAARCDLVLVDLDVVTASGTKIVEQLRKRGKVPVVLMGHNDDFVQYEKELEPLLAKEFVEWVTMPLQAAELGRRIKKVSARSAPAIETWSVPELRSDRSGRLDAARVAKHFGWTLTKLSHALGSSVQAVHKTPDAPGLQKRLEKLERAALLAQRLVSGKPAEFRKWLNTPSVDLDEEKPGELLLEDPGVVVQWLEDAALGHPA